MIFLKCYLILNTEKLERIPEDLGCPLSLSLFFFPSEIKGRLGSI